MKVVIPGIALALTAAFFLQTTSINAQTRLPTPKAAPEIITVCEESTGYGYYLEPKHDGWSKDGISKGTITIIRDASSAYDLLIKDGLGTFSTRGDGGNVVKIHGEDHLRFTLGVVYSDWPLTEIYQFMLDQWGRGIVIWASFKNQVGLINTTKGSLFTANCSK
jgi:hypothetical protein